MINLFLLFVLEIILFLIAFMITNRDILSPSCTMSAMFIVSTLFTIINANKWNVEFSFESLLILISGILTFILTEGFCKSIWSKQNIYEENLINSSVEIRNWIVVVLVIFNLFVSFWYFSEIRKIVGSTSSIGLMFSTYRNLGVSGLEGRASESVGGILNQLIKITKATGYVGVFIIISNILNAGKRKSRQNILLFVLCLTSLLPVVMIASRGGILMYFSNALIIFYILWHQKNGWHRNLSWKIIRFGIVAIVAGIPLFYYSAFLMGRKNTYGVLEYVSTYIGGSVALFNSYVLNPIPRIQFGEETLINLKKIVNALGFGSTSISYNLESRDLGLLRSNVYTFFRRPLHDFGLFGMYLFTVLVALLFCWMYYKKIKGRDRLIGVDCWVLTYGYLYYWVFASSILQYSMSYISFGCAMTISIIILLYLLLTKVRIKVY